MSQLSVVAMPIGHAGDFSSRAREVLEAADIIAAEDTRVSLECFKRLGIKPRAKLLSYRDHGEELKAQALVLKIQAEGAKVALVSDAGTPCISDPGYRIVRLARQQGIKVSAIPGPSAPILLASMAGIASDRFLFVGFLPSKLQTRAGEIKSWATANASIIAFEAPHRIKDSLRAIQESFPGIEIALGRELTKVHEEVYFGTIEGALEWAEKPYSQKGEIVFMLDPRSFSPGNQARELALRQAKMLFAHGLSVRDAMAILEVQGWSRSEVYESLLELKRIEKSSPGTP